MSKQAFSVAQEDAQAGRELVPTAALEEMLTPSGAAGPAHLHPGLLRNAGPPATIRPPRPTAGWRAPTSRSTRAASRRPPSSYQAAATPNLIIVETKLPRDAADAELDRLAEVCDAGTKVVVIGHVNDVNLYRDLLPRRQRVSRRPGRPHAHHPDLSDLYVDRRQPLGRTIAFVGGKGGVGSSMVAHNVAWAIARDFKNDVVVADLDLAFGTAGSTSTRTRRRASPRPSTRPSGSTTSSSTACWRAARTISASSPRRRPSTAPTTFDEAPSTAFIDDRAPDGRPSSSRPAACLDGVGASKTLLAADEIVLTVEPDLANLRNAKNLVDLLRSRANDAPPRLVINKTGIAKRPEIKLEDFAAAARPRRRWRVIPFDAQLFGTAANNGQMIAETDAEGPSRPRQFREIAAMTLKRTAAEHEGGEEVLRG